MTGKLLLCATIACLAGCAGYTLGPTPPTYMKGIKRVAVPILKNASITPDVEALTTTAIIKQIQEDGTYEVTGVDQADAVVNGTIVGVDRTKARSLQGNVLASAEFNLRVTIYFRVERPAGPLIAERKILGETTFFVGNDIASQEREAIPLAVQDAAAQFVSFLSEGW
ncbi:MAG: LptE family protein [Verrucomicrobia bacterium]|nr:LptE family protein [Verrucomicrobiota bacterium]